MPETENLFEIIATLLSFIYLILVIKEKKSCWYFGISGSLISVVLFFWKQLYSESLLYIYYVAIGIYGLYVWSSKEKTKEEFRVQDWSWNKHALIFAIGIPLSLGMGYLSSMANGRSAYFDAFTTIFSLIASYMEVKKVLSAWIYWIVINGATIVLYYSNDLNYYTILQIIYFGFSFVGFMSWKKKIAISQ